MATPGMAGGQPGISGMSAGARASRAEEAGAEVFQRRQSRDGGREKQGAPARRHLAPSTSEQSPRPGGSPPEMAFSETFPSFTWTKEEDLVGWNRGGAGRRKRGGTRGALLCAVVLAPVGTGPPSPEAQLSSQTALGKSLRAACWGGGKALPSGLQLRNP